MLFIYLFTKIVVYLQKVFLTSQLGTLKSIKYFKYFRTTEVQTSQNNTIRILNSLDLN